MDKFYSDTLRPILVFLFAMFIVSGLKAQSNSFEIWPETDIWYKVTKDWRLSAFVPITKYYESKDRDLNLILQADYKWGKTKRILLMRLSDDSQAQQIQPWLARAGYMYGISLYDGGENYSEDMLFAEMHRRVVLRGRVLLSHRIRSDVRWLGQKPELSYRFRYRIMLEKEIVKEKTSITPYVNVEPFYDSRYDTFNRVRCIGGATVGWKKWFALEGNFTYQYDSKSSYTNVYAINGIFHLYLERKNNKE